MSERIASLAAVLRARVRALADAGDAAGALALAAESPAAAIEPETLGLLLALAAEPGQAARLAGLVQTAADIALPPGMRAEFARRLAAAGQPMIAWHLLMSDPATLGAPHCAETTALALFRIAHEARLLGQTDPSVAALAAASLACYRRFVRKAPDLRHPTAHGFPAAERSAAMLKRRHALRILPAPGLSPAAAEAWDALDRSFEVRLSSAPAPQVFAWHDVYVNRLGQVWNQAGEVLFSRRGRLRDASRDAMHAAPRLPEAVHALGSADRNFCHWFRDALAGLAWRLTPGAPPLPLLVRDDAPGFVAESLALLGEAQNAIAVGDAVFVSRLYHAEIDIEQHVYADLFAPVYARMVEATRPRETFEGPARIYISRRDSMRRPLRNEEELEKALMARGFTVVSFSGLDLATQIQVVQAADVIVAPHGAGLAHSVAARPGTRVMELLPLFAGDRGPMFTFAQLSRIQHLRHTLWLQPVATEADHWNVVVADVVQAACSMAA